MLDPQGKLRRPRAVHTIMPDQLVPEKSLLFALLAFQNGFIGRDQLLAAFSAWMAEKSRSIDTILDEQGAISAADRAAIVQLVERHVESVADDGNQQQGSVLERVHTVREALMKEVGDDAELSQAFQTLSAEETVVFKQKPGGMAEMALSSNHFRLIKEHARGGLGRVYLAEDLRFGRQVALKQIRAEHAHEEEYRAKFLLEAEVTGQLEHPGIVPVYALGEDELGRPFYAMRFIKGEDLKSRIKQFHRQFPRGKVRLSGAGAQRDGLRQLLRRFVDACHAVSYAHDRGVLHRDLKPSNIMLGKHGETLVVDWGLAKPLGVKLSSASADATLHNTELPLGTSDTASGSETRYGSFVGTAAYAPPEQVLGSLDKLGPTSDVYSLGAILYEMLSGQPPLADKDVSAIIRKVTCGDIVPITEVRPDAPPELAAVCRRAMSLAREDRYPSVSELRQDVQRWLDDLPVQAYREPWRQRSSRWMRRHPKWVATLASALVIGTVGFGIGSLLLERKNVDLELKNIALESSQREANQRRLDAELALYDSLVSQSQLLVRQAGYPGWSWEAEQKLQQATTIVPIDADPHRLRTLLLASVETEDFRSVASLADGIDCAALCFSHDGRYLAIGQRKHNLASSIFVYATSNWQLVTKLPISAGDGGLTGLGEVATRLLTGERHQEGVLTLSFSPDGKWLAAGTRLGRIHLWRADSDFQLADNAASNSATHFVWQPFEVGGVAQVAFAPDGNSLVTSSDVHGNYRMNAWTLSDGLWNPSAEGFVDSATGLEENGRGLLVGLTGSQLKWFDSRSLTELQHPSLPHVEAQAVAFAPATNLVAYVASGSMIVSDLETGRQSRLTEFAPESLVGNIGLSFDATSELLAITNDGPQVTIVDTVNGRLTKREIAVPGRDQPTAVFSPRDGLLAVTTQSGVEVYERRGHLPAFAQMISHACQQVDDVVLDHATIWSIAQDTQGLPPIYQLRQFTAAGSPTLRLGTLYCDNAGSLPTASFLSTQPLRFQIPGRALLEHEPISNQVKPSVAVTNRELSLEKQAQLKLAIPLEAQYLGEHECLNGPVAQVAADLGQVGELHATHSGEFAFGITNDGDGVLCLNLADCSVVGKWSSHLESNITGDASPMSLDVVSEFAVVGGSDGIVHVLQSDGKVVGRGQWSKSQLVSIDTFGRQCVAGALNGDALVGRLDQLDKSSRWHAHNAPVRAIVLVPDAPLVVTGSSTGEVTLWRQDADAMHAVLSFPTGKSSVQRLRLDKAGQRLAIVYDHSSAVHVWDLVRLQEYFDSYRLGW